MFLSYVIHKCKMKLYIARYINISSLADSENSDDNVKKK